VEVAVGAYDEKLEEQIAQVRAECGV